MNFRSKLTVLPIVGLLTAVAIPQTHAFRDVSSATTQYMEAISTLRERGVIEGYEDGTFRPNISVNRAEFVKIILEAQAKESGVIAFIGNKCFPDVRDEWFAKYVCTAKERDIIAGYPDGTFKPDRPINFAEAAKIVAVAYGQDVEGGRQWYEGFVRALDGSNAIPRTVANLEHQVTRGEMVELMWRLGDGRTDQPSKGYMNVKYPELAINMGSDTASKATSCADIQSFVQEANESYHSFGYMEEDAMFDMAPGGPRPVMMRSMATESAAVGQAGTSGGTSGGSFGGGGGAAKADFSDTNVQVVGVDEGDIVKTDGTYLYIIRQQKTYIVRAAPTSEMEVLSVIDTSDNGFSPSDLYINGSTLTLIGNNWQYHTREPQLVASMIAPDFYGGSRTEVRLYDVLDRKNPKLERTLSFEGSQVSSRRIGDTLYLVMNKGLGWPGGPIPLAEDILPRMSDSNLTDKDVAVSRCSDVVILPRVPSPQYLMVARIPTEDDQAQVQVETVLGNGDNVYMSLNNLYVANTSYDYVWRAGRSSSNEKTTIFRFALEDNGIALKQQGTVPGRILNQFSMDEHDNHFRIATTKGQIWDESTPSTNNLYILNIGMEQVGQIEGIAPGERIYSTRFVGDRTYMVTFKKVDPFFVIDTSDPRNPTILGKLKIPGYSDYLHPYDENHILGFGKEAVEAKDGDFAWYQGMKIALFDVTDVSNPVERHKLTIGDRGTESPLLHNHKALLFERDRDLLAFPVTIHKLTEQQKSGDPGSAWGDAVFQGAQVYRLTLDNGFQLLGQISHYTEQDQLKAGSYFYGKNIERILRLGESLLTVSEVGVQSHSIDTVQKQAGILYSGHADDEVGNCPSSNADGVVYISQDPDSCALIKFSCQDSQTPFSGECGCGCK